mgnify:CR=1 FL=1
MGRSDAAVLHGQGWQVVGGFEPEAVGEERQLGLQRTDHVGGPAEPVALVRELDEGERHALALQGIGHEVCLGGGNHGILGALEQQDRGGQAIHVVDGRPLPVDGLVLRRSEEHTSELQSQ